MSNVAPKIALDYSKNRIRICYSTLEALSNPTYVAFLINPDKKTIGIMKCNDSMTEKHRIRPTHTDSRSCEIYSQLFLEKMRQLNVGFVAGHKYELEGVRVPDKDIVLFSLNNYVESEEQYVG